MLRAMRSAAEGFCTRMYSIIPAKSAADSGDPRSGAEVALHLVTHFLVRDGFASIQWRETLPNLFPEPLVVIKVAGNQLLHNLVRLFTCLGSDLVQLGFELRSKRNLHGMIVGRLLCGNK